MRPDHPGRYADRRTGELRVGLTVPCGKCVSCMATRSAQWSVRAYHESQLRDKNCFITLTYDDDHIPQDGKLRRSDLQDFWRELRRKLPPRSLRYLACGEYGEKTHRPHYHALLFGVDFRQGSLPLTEGFYTHPDVQAIWGKGIISISSVNMATCCYVAGYATKKLGAPDTFVTMSKKPGLGHGWLDKYSDEIRNNGCVVIEGRRLPIPKKYFEWEWMDDLKEASAAHTRANPKKVAAKRSQHVNAVARFNNRQEKI